MRENSVCIKLDDIGCCPSCVSKIEEKLKKLPTVKSADLNFINKEVTISFIGSTIKEITNNLNTITAVLEPYTGEKNNTNQETKIHFESNKSTIHSDKKEIKENNSKLLAQSKLNIKMKIKLARFAVGFLLYVLCLLGVFEGNIEICVYVASYILFAYDIVFSAINNILKGKVFDENFLMSVSTIGAFAIKEYPEAVAVMIFFQVGEFLQDLAVEKSRKNIKDLMNIKAEYANILENGQIKQVEPSTVNIGEIILIKPGEKIPLDGIIIEGTTQLNVSSLIGEAVPRSAVIGDEVLSGAINCDGVIKVRVTKDYKNSTVVKIMELVENASSKKAPTEKFITKFSRYYTPIVVFAAISLALIPPLLFSGESFSEWLSRALVFLVVSCPCAMVVSVPLTFFSGIGSASKNGILIKGSNYLQLMSQIDTVVFDKTGTLTKGVFEVSAIEPSEGITEDELLQTASYIERLSTHPIAKSIISACENMGLYNSQKEVNEFSEISGKGLKGVIDDEIILVGNSKLMKDYNITYKDTDSIGTIVYLAKNSIYLGYIVISDSIKGDSKSAISNLKQTGINDIYMLTGDRKESAEKIATNIGINKVYSDLLPFEKVEKLEEIYSENPKRKVIFVGDGINDSPILTRADVGIAMGGVGSDAAIEAADVVIMNDEPSKIHKAIIISKNTIKIVKQNIAFALLVKFSVLSLATLGYANMWLAVFADVGVTLIVVLNSMRKK